MGNNIRDYKIRNYKLDNLKSLLIILVVFGHLLECFGGALRWWVYLVIYSFHMPAFAYATGYFSRMNPRRLLENLFYPYCIYQILYLLFQRYILMQENVIQFATPYWLLWYLMTTICWMFLIPILDYYAYAWKYLLAVLVVMSLLIGFDNSIGYYLSLSRTIVLLPFFALGYFRVFDRVVEIFKRGQFAVW